MDNMTSQEPQGEQVPDMNKLPENKGKAAAVAVMAVILLGAVLLTVQHFWARANRSIYEETRIGDCVLLRTYQDGGIDLGECWGAEGEERTVYHDPSWIGTFTHSLIGE